MINYIKELENRLDKKWIAENILSLYRIERAQTFPAYQNAAKFVHNLLMKENFLCELVNVPADGKTVYQDAYMPIGWDVKNMTLTVLSDVEGIDDPVICDYSKNPLSSVKHSVSTPENGIRTKLVSEADFNNGKSIKGCFIFLDRNKKPGGNIIKTILDAGAWGWVSDFCENPGEAPDHTAWLNAGTETGSWHVNASDRDFISYMITPNHGDALRKALLKGDIEVMAYSDARRYETVLPFISAYLPGESKKEIWVTAHMYEPLIDDNANGVIGSIAILKAIRDMAQEGIINLKYSIRLVFAGEFYGFASAAEYYGGCLSDRTLAGINMDGIPGSVEKGKYRSWRIFEGVEHPINAANIIAGCVEASVKECHPEYTFTHCYGCKLGDDMALADSTIALPMTWFIRGNYNCFHHNSILSEAWFDVDVLVDSLVISALWILLYSSLSKEDLLSILPGCIKRSQEYINIKAKSKIRSTVDYNKYMKFLYEKEKNSILSLKSWYDIPEIKLASDSLYIPDSENILTDTDNTSYDKCAEYVYKRLTRGLPMDMTRIDDKDKQFLRGLFIYFPIAELLSRMDGIKNLKEIINEYEWTCDTILSEENIKKYLDMCFILEEYGYIERIKE